MKIQDFINRVFKPTPRFGKMDVGVLKVAFMIAALDGRITDEEYAAFDEIARGCRGYTRENAEATLRAAMRSAGYLLLLSTRVDDKAFAQAFIDEAMDVLPSDFPLCEIEDLTCAFDLWIEVAKSDNDYSPRERLCLESLKKFIDEIRKDEIAWMTYTSALRI